MAPLMVSKMLYCLIIGTIFVVSINARTEPEESGPILFRYKGINGPNKWGSLKPEYKVCGDGKAQSPINIVTKELVDNNTIIPYTTQYGKANATLVNYGVYVGIQFESDAGYFSMDGKNYTLKHAHWHTPSEHTIDGIKYAAELHMVHVSAVDGSRAVVSQLYKYGLTDPLIAKLQLKTHLADMSKMNVKYEQRRIPLGNINANHMRRYSLKYYRYQGSLTKPPCDEGVVWLILRKVEPIGKDQVEALKVSLAPEFKENARSTQATNGRKVESYTISIQNNYNKVTQNFVI